LDDYLSNTPIIEPGQTTDATTTDYFGDCEDTTTPGMGELNDIKNLMFPLPMTAKEFIERNPFVDADGYIKRPSNNFILFRKIAHHQKSQAPILFNYNERQWSQILGKIWKNLSYEEKKAYRDLGNQVASLHREMFPEYKFQPKHFWRHFIPIENNSREQKIRGIKNDVFMGCAIYPSLK
jgi:hypothetical protein